jgi:hypothetical protein
VNTAPGGSHLGGVNGARPGPSAVFLVAAGFFHFGLTAMRAPLTDILKKIG